MKTETFKKRFGEKHPALMDGFMQGFSQALNGKWYWLTMTKNGIVAKKPKKDDAPESGHYSRELTQQEINHIYNFGK